MKHKKFISAILGILLAMSLCVTPVFAQSSSNYSSAQEKIAFARTGIANVFVMPFLLVNSLLSTASSNS